MPEWSIKVWTVVNISEKYDLEDFNRYIKRAENSTVLTDHYQVKEENDY